MLIYISLVWKVKRHRNIYEGVRIYQDDSLGVEMSQVWIESGNLISKHVFDIFLDGHPTGFKIIGSCRVWNHL